MPVDPWAIDSLVFSGLEARNADSAFVMANGTALGSISGVRPGDPGLTVTLAGTTINCSAGVAAVAYSGQGVYRVALPSSVSPGTYTAPHATLNRVDLVYLRVWDNSVDASGLNKGDVVYLAGTPSSTPVAPTPAGTQIYMPLATITVLSVSNGSTASVSTAVRPNTVAPGGILPTATAPSSPYIGQYYDNGTDLLRWNGSTWDTYQKVPGAWTAYTPVWTASTNPVLGNGTLIGRYSKFGRDVRFHINLTCGGTTTYGSGGYGFTLPFTAATNGATMIGTVQLLGTNRWAGQIVISPSATGTSTLFPASQTDCRLAFHSATVPETMASGAQVRITGSYESAT
ncbi:hypothetical protein OG762_37110 [Streptomyces sp. NBC_01136]|uniref:hypothetical protein n=1 Tax=Streptomyces sp. NBC_01136 TaxID=2903754 RepID=UPI00386376AF|nr:hypothetical protein OG762_37110 [Streptomyces sp. NBC_01136]